VSEMIKRMAQAMCDADTVDGPGYETLAHTALLAMRAPTEAMIASDELPYSPGEMILFWEIMIDAALPAPPVEAKSEVGG
jgi:hypothetical protein